jgi:hypothetical protein
MAKSHSSRTTILFSAFQWRVETGKVVGRKREGEEGNGEKGKEENREEGKEGRQARSGEGRKVGRKVHLRVVPTSTRW